jgi:predicted NAD/FAD-dependent oxidoreductase
MHKLAIIAAAVATISCAGSLSRNPAEAAIFGTTTGVRLAAEDLNPVETAHYGRCWWRHGYRHCHRHHHCWWRHGYRHCHGYRY